MKSKISFTLIMAIAAISTSCRQRENTLKLSNSDIPSSFIDTCKTIDLTDSLYAGFMLNMTYAQCYKHLDSLLSKKVVNTVDTSVSIYIPYLVETPTEIRLTVVPIFRGCRLNEIKLIGFATAEEQSQISYIDNLMIKKYGKGVEDGYTDLVLSNGKILDGLYGTQSALLQMKEGDAVVATRKKSNDATSGRRLWKSKGVQVELFYRQNIGMIEIEYKSINAITTENLKKEAEEKHNDSINQTKIDSSLNSF